MNYNTTPPAVNMKCIVFTLCLALGYWYLPPKNKWILLALLYFPYIILAWYDWWYQCQRNMGPTYLALFYWWAKPPESEQIQTYRNWHPDIRRKVLLVDLVVLGVCIALIPWFMKLK
jgi:hypothetical protein